MICFRIRCACWTALILTLIVPWLWADNETPPIVFPAESKPTAGRIEEVHKLIASQKWSEAVQEIQAILTASGDELVSVSPGRDVVCRRLCHALFGRYAAGRSAILSQRRGSAGKKMAGTGRADARCATVAPGGGRGVLQSARRKSHRLARRLRLRARRLRGGRTVVEAVAAFPDAAALFYPDSKIEPAPAHAKILLARLFRGAYGWADDLRVYRKNYGAVEGDIAGKKGRYADMLQHITDGARPIRRRRRPIGPRLAATLRRQHRHRAPRLLDRLGALCRSPNEHQFSLRDRKSLEVEPVYDRGVRRYVEQSLDGVRAGRRRRKGVGRRRSLCDGL